MFKEFLESFSDRGEEWKSSLERSYIHDNIAIYSEQEAVKKLEKVANKVFQEKIKDKIPPYKENLEIGVLIGCNCPKAIKPKEVILGKGEDPYAVRTVLGWCIVGPVGAFDTSCDEDSSNPSTCNRIVTREILPESRGLSFVPNSPTKEVINPSAVKQLFELDFAENKSTSSQGLSKEDRRFLSIAEQGIHKCDDGHYELPLPLKNAHIELPNNRELALRRLNQLKKKFVSKEGKKYRDDYVAFMKYLLNCESR